MNTDNRLSRALHELIEVPGPDGMADKALKRAKARRIKGYAASTAGAFAAAAIIAAPFLLATGGGQAQGIQVGAAPSAPPAAAANENAQPCEAATSEPRVKRVTPENWPGYVRATIDRLPARSDYVMQSGTLGLCNGQAYSVINLGEMREAGHITVRLSAQPDEASPADCSKVRSAETNPEAPPPPSEFKIVFCVERGGDFRLVYGIDNGYNNYRVYAIRADGRVVSMESIGASGDTSPTITAEQLRVVVTDPAMLAFFG